MSPVVLEVIDATDPIRDSRTAINDNFAALAAAVPVIGTGAGQVASGAELATLQGTVGGHTTSIANEISRATAAENLRATLASLPINMIAEGADPSGNTACDSILAAAIVKAQAGPYGKIRPIYWPTGRYKLTAAVTPYNGMSWIGPAGGEKEFGRRCIIYNTTTNIFTYSTDVNDVLIQGICFNGNGTAVADAVTTSASTTLTSATAAFTSAMTGKAIKGAGIPGGTTLTFVNATTVTLSQAATATATGVTIQFGGGTSFLTPNNTNNLNDWVIKECGFNYFQPVWASQWLRPFISQCYFNNCFFNPTYSMLTFYGSDGTFEDSFIGASYFPGSGTVTFLVDFNGFQRSWFRGNYVTPTPVMGLRVYNSHSVKITDNEFDANDPTINGTTITGCDGPPITVHNSWGVTLSGNVTSLASRAPFSFYSGHVNVVDSQAVSINGHIVDTSAGTVFRINQAAGAVDNIKITGTVYRNSTPNTNVTGTVTNISDDTYGAFGQVLAKASSYSMGILDGAIQATSGTAGITITLPVPAFKKTVRVGKVDAAVGNVSIATPTGTITGTTTLGTQNTWGTYMSDGTNYSKVA